MFEGFERRRAQLDGAEIDYVVAGAGPPLLLLHGYPQTRAMWHSVAPALAAAHTVVVPDLRGYGASRRRRRRRPRPASFRAMAADVVGLLRRSATSVRGCRPRPRRARAHRLALDHPDAVERAAVLDIVPTLTMYEQHRPAFATGYYHWFFLIQPAPLPGDAADRRRSSLFPARR